MPHRSVCRLTRFAAALALLVGVLPGLVPAPAMAQAGAFLTYLDQSELESASAVPAPALEALRADPTVADIALGRVTPQAAFGTGVFVLALPGTDGEVARFEGLELETTASGNRKLSAPRVPFSARSLTVVLTERGATGTVRTEAGLFKMTPVGQGLTAVYRVDESQMIDHPPGGPAIPPRFPSRPESGAPAETGPDGRTELDVIVAYTERAADEAEDIDALIELAITETNEIYEISDVPARLVLAHSYQTSYVESAEDMGDDLDAFTDIGDGALDEVHGLRDAHRADLAVLLVGSNDRGGCGIAWLFADAELAFGVVAQNCATGYYSFGHEIGHNLGAHHDPATSKNANYPYGHGYCNTRKGEEGGWRTVMSYNADDCSSRQPIFSRAEPFKGIVVGDARQRNNARVLRETIAAASRFRLRTEAPSADMRGTGLPAGLGISTTDNFGVGGAGANQGAQRIIFD
ncbi:MAG: M12 family metallo-peptidase [Pikeienuella sp.]